MAAKTSTGGPTGRKRAKKSPLVRTIKRGILLTLMLLLIAFIGVSANVMMKFRDVDGRFEVILDKANDLDRKPSRIVSSDGKVLYLVSSEYRIPVKLADVPKHVQQAIVAAEDKRFYEHSGVDLIGLARVAFIAARNGHASQGASTLTMQLAKQMSDGSQATLDRKVDDMVLAYEMERKMTKDQILELYLNWCYFGENAHGIAAAAKVYFNKDLKDLTIGEAAMLARCVRHPSTENPIRNLKVATENRNVVLDIMHKEGMITDSEFQTAFNEKPHINRTPRKTTALKPNGAEYFVDHVLDVLKNAYPDVDLKAGGYTIETTLNSVVERRAEEAVREVVAENRANKVNDGAFVMIDRTGAILAEVGGIDYRKNETNIIYNGHRQPGSSFKPIVYSMALKDGVLSGPDAMVSNAPIRRPDPSRPGGYWVPQNDAKWMNAGSYTLRTALADSINLPAIHTLENEGPDKVVEAAHSIFGFKSDFQPYLPLAIGAEAVNPLELAQAYSVFMLRGSRVAPFAIKRIIGPDGQVVADFQPQPTLTALPPAVCDTVDTLLRSVVEHGTATAALSVPDARGKTGTTNSNRDAWFCGYTGGLLGVGWCGNVQMVGGIPTPVPMGRHAFGGTVTVNIWTRVMKTAREVLPDETKPIVTPDNTAQVAADSRAAGKFVSEQKTESVPPATADSDDNLTTPPDAPDSVDPSASPSDARPLSQPGDAAVAETGPRTSDPQPPALPADPPKKVVRRDTKPKLSEYVTVRVCGDTGLLATDYCPETVLKQYRRGTQPKKYCTMHNENTANGG